MKTIIKSLILMLTVSACGNEVEESVELEKKKNDSVAVIEAAKQEGIRYADSVALAKKKSNGDLMISIQDKIYKLQDVLAQNEMVLEEADFEMQKINEFVVGRTQSEKQMQITQKEREIAIILENIALIKKDIEQYEKELKQLDN